MLLKALLPRTMTTSLTKMTTMTMTTNQLLEDVVEVAAEAEVAVQVVEDGKILKILSLKTQITLLTFH